MNTENSTPSEQTLNKEQAKAEAFKRWLQTEQTLREITAPTLDIFNQMGYNEVYRKGVNILNKLDRAATLRKEKTARKHAYMHGYNYDGAKQEKKDIHRITQVTKEAERNIEKAIEDFLEVYSPLFQYQESYPRNAKFPEMVERIFQYIAHLAGRFKYVRPKLRYIQQATA